MQFNQHAKGQQIPEWFLKMREDAWEDLEGFIGSEKNAKLVKEVETKVNALIERWDRNGNQVTHRGRVVNLVEMNIIGGKLNINFN